MEYEKRIPPKISGLDLFTSLCEYTSPDRYLYAFPIRLSDGRIVISRSDDPSYGTVEITDWLKRPVRFVLDQKGLSFFKKESKEISRNRVCRESYDDFTELDVPLMKWILDCNYGKKYLHIPKEIKEILDRVRTI